MRYFINTILITFFWNMSNAQIKTLECEKLEKDTVIIYNLKIKFNTYLNKNERLRLIKKELERNYNIDSSKIISIDSWIGKYPKTYLFRVKIEK